MSGSTMMTAIGNINDRYIMEFSEEMPLKKSATPIVKWFLPLAGCLCAASMGIVLWLTAQGNPPAGEPQIIAPIGTTNVVVTTTPQTVPPTIPPTSPQTTSGWEIALIGVVGGNGADLGMEKFYEDEYNEYISPWWTGADVTVRYYNGTTENIVDALNAGRATLNDLTRFGFTYYTRPKNNG